MKDFTLSAYKGYLEAIRQHQTSFFTFGRFLSDVETPESLCLIRHDVDRKPQNALSMARLEAEIEISATYYFRTKPSTFQPDIVKSIAGLGHEIGYHYESLSDARGDFDSALTDFEKNLARMRDIVEIKTISMHGRPLLPYDNRDIWKDPERKKLLSEKFNLLGEVYLDIDYTDIAYINDTGRNWLSGKANRRDKVSSNVPADFPSGELLLNYLKNRPHKKIVFQVHPERWSDDKMEWWSQRLKDGGINLIKSIISQKEDHGS